MKSEKETLGLGFAGLLFISFVLPTFITLVLSGGYSEGIVFFGIFLFYVVSFVIGIVVLKSAKNCKNITQILAYFLGVLNVTAFIWQLIILVLLFYLFFASGSEIKVLF